MMNAWFGGVQNKKQESFIEVSGQFNLGPRFGNLSNQSILRYLPPEANFTAMGSLNKTQNSMKSKVYRCTIWEPEIKRFCLENGFDDPYTTHCIPTFDKPMIGGNSNPTRPHYVSLLQITQKKATIPWRLLAIAINDYLDFDLPTKRVKPLTVGQAVRKYGYSRGLNMSTSAGYPFYCLKSDLISIEDDKVKMNSTLKKLVEHCHEELKSGNEIFFPFQGSLKDERISIKKNNEGRVRLFTGSSVVHTILGRMYFLPVVDFFMDNGIVMECALGVNTFSEVWDKFYSHLVSFGEDNIVAGDYKEFDKKFPDLITRAVWVIIKCIMAVHLKYTNEEMAVAEKLFNSLMNIMILGLRYDVMEISGTNPSGQFLTLILNCIGNSLYLRVVWWKLGHFGLFRKSVHLLTYGDDCILGTNNKEFNHVSIAKVLAEMNITFTMADKTSELVPFISIDQATFLKRYFRRVEDVIFDPIEQSSMLLSLAWPGHSTFLTDSEVQLEILKNVEAESRRQNPTDRRRWISLIEKLQSCYNREYQTDISILDDIIYDHHLSAVRELRKLPEKPPLDPEADVATASIGSDLIDIVIQGRDIPRDFFRDYSDCRLESLQIAPLVNVCQSINKGYSPGEIDAWAEWPARSLLNKTLTNNINKTPEEDSLNLNLTVCVTQTTPVIAGILVNVSSLTMASTDNKPTITTSQPVVDFVGDGEKEESSDKYEVSFNPMRGYQDSSLAEFLSRPRVILAGSWTYNSTINTSVTIEDLLTLAPVAAKIRDYYLLRATWCVNVQFTGSPFHQGCFTVKWNPLEDGDKWGGPRLGSGSSLLLQRSQLPGSEPLEVCNSPSHVIKVPFVSQFDYFKISDLGTLDPWGEVVTLGYTSLLTANGSTLDSPYLITSWLEDVDLTIPLQTVSETHAITNHPLEPF